MEPPAAYPANTCKHIALARAAGIGGGLGVSDITRSPKINREMMAVNTVEQIERPIRALTPTRVGEWYSWLDQKYSLLIDSRIQSELEAGRLHQSFPSRFGRQKRDKWTQPL
jgi:hypothetical protein